MYTLVNHKQPELVHYKHVAPRNKRTKVQISVETNVIMFIYNELHQICVPRLGPWQVHIYPNEDIITHQPYSS